MSQNHSLVYFLPQLQLAFLTFSDRYIIKIIAFYSLGNKSNLNVNIGIQVLVYGNRQFLTPFFLVQLGLGNGKAGCPSAAGRVFAVAEGSHKKHNILLLLAWIYGCHGDCIIHPAS